MNSPRKANIFLLFFLIYSIVLELGISMLALSLDQEELKVFQYYLVIFQDFALILIPLIIYFLAAKTSPLDIIPHKRLSLKNAAYVVLITFFSLPVLLLAANIAALFFEDTANDTIAQYITNMSMPTALFSMAVMPSIFEESLCRGVFMSNYKTTSPIIMYVISGLFFGIIHLNFQQMSYAAAAGILFAFFVHYTNSIYSSILAHFFINGYQVVLSKLFVTEEVLADQIAVSSEYMTFTTAADYISLAIGIAFIAIIFYFFIYTDIKLIKKFIAKNKANADEYMNNESGSNKKFADPYFISAIALFLIISVITEVFKI